MPGGSECRRGLPGSRWPERAADSAALSLPTSPIIAQCPRPAWLSGNSPNHHGWQGTPWL